MATNLPDSERNPGKPPQRVASPPGTIPPPKRPGTAPHPKQRKPSFWILFKIPERSSADLLDDLAAMRTAVIDAAHIMESFMRAIIWLISLPVRFITALASLIVALCVIVPVGFLLFFLLGNANGNDIQRAMVGISNGAVAYANGWVRDYASNHPNSWIGEAVIGGPPPQQPPVAAQNVNSQSFIQPSQPQQPQPQAATP